MMYPIRLLRLTCLGALLLFLLPTFAQAQYFGRNKVQYDAFDFRVLRTPHFDIYYYPEMREAADDAARMSERWYTRLSSIFNHQFTERKAIILYANDADFQQTNVIEGFIGQGTGGVTEGLQNRVVMPFTGSYAEFDHVLGHELVHAFQYDIAQTRGGGLSALGQIPLWFIEGMAEYLSVGRYDPNTAMWLRDAVLHDDLPSLRDLTNNPRFFPYRFGQAFWAYVGGTYGDESVTRLFVSAVQARQDSTDFLPADLEAISGDSLSVQWNRLIRETYQPLIAERVPPREVGQRVLAEDVESGSLNISPALSPDGNYVAFLSERNLFSIDLFLADARTGRILSTLNSTARDAHADALRFINSSGTWSPDGKQFAFVIFREGDNEIIVIDVNTRRTVQQFKPEGVGAIANPAWSPDGELIAFSGIAGGISDLYTYNLTTGETTQITRGKASAFHPAWSPDGRYIAFATDEGSDFRNLSYSEVQVALYDTQTRETRLLPIFGEGIRHSNPQFAPDGRNLYFLSDRGGFTNIYRLDLGTSDVYQVTDVVTGITGITPMSPALTVASETGRLMFSIFENANHVVHSLEPEEAQGTRVERTTAVDRTAGLLPPVTAPAGPVASYLADNLTGLPPADTTFSLRDYSPKLRLTYIGAPTIGFAADRYGAYFGGSVSFLFSDVLGNQMLFLGLQAQGRVQDIGGQVYYLNRKHRLNWGGTVARIPYMSGFTTFTDLDNDGYTDALDNIIYRVYYDQVAGVASYPFSTTRRVEAELGYLHVGYGAEVDRFYINEFGQIVDRDRLNADEAGLDFLIPDGLHMAQGTVAYVGDNSFFGFTSPIQGWRYRLGVEGTAGSITYGSLNADYRHYFFARPVTFAFRGIHYGRYGPDADGLDDNGNRRLQPLYLGYGTLLRGYSYDSFEAQEIRDNPMVFDRLLGSRIGVVNAEMRVPLFGSEQLGLFSFPFLPTELSFFVDGGIAWTGEDGPEFDFTRRSTERIPVFSAGTSARVNLLGFAVLEFYYAYPFQRPDKGWHFGFTIAPGW